MLSRSGLRCAVPVLAVLLIGGVGCGDRYMGRFQYEPNPYSTTLAGDVDGSAGPVQVLVSVLGVRETKDGKSAELVSTFVLENMAEQPVRFDPNSLALFSADLERFQEPVTEPSEPTDIEAGERHRVLARFEFPAGMLPEDLDMAGLSLRWTVDIAGEDLTRSTTFTRTYTPRHYSYRRTAYGNDAYRGEPDGLYYHDRRRAELSP